MNNLNRLAWFGASPRIARELHAGQINLPSWEKIEKAMGKIFEREYFTNNGPLVQQFEQEFAAYLNVSHAVCVANGTFALMIMYKALDLKDEVIVPAYTFPATVQALSWAGLKPVLCDVDPKTQIPSILHIETCLTPQTSAIVLTHTWGRSAHSPKIETFAKKHGLKLAYDACHGIGCIHNGQKIGNFGMAEAFSFHATKIINAAEGGCVVTNDDGLAVKLRASRSFHSCAQDPEGILRLNGKMSEAQAALALLSLEDLPLNLEANRIRYEAYRQALVGIPGVTLDDYNSALNNHQYVNVFIDEAKAGLSRDKVFDLLAAENIFCRRHFMPGMHNTPPYNNSLQNHKSMFKSTDWLCRRILQLPNSQNVSVEDVAIICDLIREIISLGPQIRLAKEE
jgi:dTDP-4-amino-4,6-dideoxygalactose transaminase